jgi:DNA repair protein RadC
VELGRRYYKEALLSVSALANPEAVKTFLRAQLQDRHYEVFGCLYLDQRFRMLNFEEIFRGTIDSANVYPREVVRQVLMYNATAIIVAHNHPSGCCEPSTKDEGMTQRLQQALSLVNVKLVDHYIVGDGECYSFAEHGLL